MYITRSNLSSNITEIAVYIGDDGGTSITTFPPTNESSPTDYFSIYAQQIQIILIIRFQVQVIIIVEILFIVLILMQP